MSEEITKQPQEEFVPKEWMNVKEVAQFLGVKTPTVYAWVSQRRIPHHKPRGTQLLRFNLDEINEWLKQARVETEEEYFTRTKGG